VSFVPSFWEFRTGPDMTEKNQHPRRRSARMVLRVPLFINSSDTNGETEWEPVETVMVSLHGGMLRAKQNFQVGDTLDIRVRDKDRSARARVVWSTSEVTTNGVVELGFEILDQEGFWEINFPPDRWSQRFQDKPDEK
jgi:PilZ domain